MNGKRNNANKENRCNSERNADAWNNCPDLALFSVAAGAKPLTTGGFGWVKKVFGCYKGSVTTMKYGMGARRYNVGAAGLVKEELYVDTDRSRR